MNTVLLMVFNDVINPMARIVTNTSETGVFIKPTPFTILVHGNKYIIENLLNSTNKYYYFVLYNVRVIARGHRSYNDILSLLSHNVPMD